MVNLFFYNAISVLVLCVMLQPSSAHVTKSSKLIGFSTYLIHRDSYESPLYDPSLNETNFISRSIDRYKYRLSHFTSTLKDVNSNSKVMDADSTMIRSATGEYLMEFSIGTPPVKQFAIVDTGSNLIWTQCEPCISCYKQPQPIFDSRKSSSFDAWGCNSKMCNDMRQSEFIHIRPCNDTNFPQKYCNYVIEYSDDSKFSGTLAYEIFKMTRSNAFKIVYGCTKYTPDENIKRTSAGMVGLGVGNFSFISQISDSIDGKFSYCLVHGLNYKAKSKINFGSNAIVSGQGVVSTPLVIKYPNPGYYVTLLAISVENITISFSISGHVEKGNIMIDSGATLTYFPRVMFQKLVDALRSVIKATPVTDPRLELERLCYKNTWRFKFPTITFHFEEGANVTLNTNNTMLKHPEATCLSIIPIRRNEVLYGNLFQMNHLIGYDLVRKKVYFKPTIC